MIRNQDEIMETIKLELGVPIKIAKPGQFDKQMKRIDVFIEQAKKIDYRIDMDRWLCKTRANRSCSKPYPLELSTRTNNKEGFLPSFFVQEIIGEFYIKYLIQIFYKYRLKMLKFDFFLSITYNILVNNK